MAIPWGAIVNAGVQAYGAYDARKEQNKMAKEAAKPTIKTSTPYGNEFIARVLPWLFDEMQARYAGRLGRLGVTPTDFSPFKALLAGIPQNYAGVQGQTLAGLSASPAAAEPAAGPSPAALAARERREARGGKVMDSY